MRGLPLWIIGLLAALTFLLLYFGVQDREESGNAPIIMGVLFAIFTLAAIGGKLRGDEA